MAAVNRANAPQNYRTPPAFLAAVQTRFAPIEWDAACTTEDCVVPKYRGYCLDRGWDALSRDWSELGRAIVWCNPPFGKSGQFAAKIAAAPGIRALLLCQASIDSAWYAAHVHGRALVLALSPRIAFVGEKQGINRALILCAYGFGPPGFEPWRWDGKQAKEHNASERT